MKIIKIELEEQRRFANDRLTLTIDFGSEINLLLTYYVF